MANLCMYIYTAYILFTYKTIGILVHDMFIFRKYLNNDRKYTNVYKI